MLEKEKQIEELSAKQSSLEQANVELQGKVAELEVTWKCNVLVVLGWLVVGWLVLGWWWWDGGGRGMGRCECIDLVLAEKCY